MLRTRSRCIQIAEYAHVTFQNPVVHLVHAGFVGERSWVIQRVQDKGASIRGGGELGAPRTGPDVEFPF